MSNKCGGVSKTRWNTSVFARGSLECLGVDGKISGTWRNLDTGNWRRCY
jgi:hypothetical protein